MFNVEACKRTVLLLSGDAGLFALTNHQGYVDQAQVSLPIN